MNTPARILFALLALCLSLPALHAQAGKNSMPLNILEASQRWQFLPGTEFPPGGKGSFTTARENGKPVGILAYDMTDGGNYVGAITNLAIPQGYSELRFRAASDMPASIGIRMVDASGQTHQTYLSYSEAGGSQLFRIDLTRRAPLKYGGANDGTLHYPIKQFVVLIQRKGLREPGTIRFSDFVLFE